MSKFVKLISDGTWYDIGTEVYTDKDFDRSPLKRMSLTEFQEWEKDGIVVVCGYRNGQLDGECCSLDEFTVEVVEED
jgi:hypothetical protein